MLTDPGTPPKPASVGRPKINQEQTPARFPSGTLARIDAALAEKENRSDFIRVAVEHELERRAEGEVEPAAPALMEPKAKPAPTATDQRRILVDPGQTAAGAAVPLAGTFDRKPYQKGQKRPR